MEQIAVNFTDGWVPKTWLTPTVTIIDRAWNTYIENWALKELWHWWYIYNFNRYSPDKVYLYVFDWGSALSNDYDRYKFGGNEFDAYSNKYSWGRTAAPYFTSINGRFDRVDKSIKDVQKLKYDDKDVKKSLNEINSLLKWQWGDSFKSKLDSILRNIRDVQDAVVDTSTTNDWNSSKNFNGINGKLDLMAEYVVRMKENLDSELNSLDENVAQRITESNTSLTEGMSNRVTIDQLLQQVERLESRMNAVLDTFVRTQMEWLLPKEISDQYDMNITRKGGMTDEEMMAALGIPTNEWNKYWLNQWLNEWMGMWMEEWLSEWLWEARPEQMNAPVDMQWIAEPEMPTTI